MLATLIPLFDSKMFVKAYSVFAQKHNYFLNPSLLGTSRLDGAGYVDGLELVSNLGLETVASDKMVFVEVSNISVFAPIEEQCKAPHEQIVLLINNEVTPTETYIKRLKELRGKKYKLAIRKLPIEEFENFKDILKLMDYIVLDSKKIRIDVAKVYFYKQYPNIKLLAANVDTQEAYETLLKSGGYDLYEGAFFRMPIVKSDLEVSPLKVNYIELLNIVNEPDYDLTDAAKVLERDAALVISLLEMVNRMTLKGGVSSVQHATAMLGQKELKKWINTATSKELLADRPTEIMRLSMMRAKFAENLAKTFGLAQFSQELFLMGLFSVVDIMIGKPMDEALKMLHVDKKINDALLNKKGELYPVLNFICEYENASWQEVSRLMILGNYSMDDIYNAYVDALKWYSELFPVKK